MINWSIFKIKKKKLNKWFFKFWGFCYNLYAQANFVILKLIELSLTTLGHASFDYTVHASYRLVFFVLFYANLQSALGFSCFLFWFFFVCLVLSLASCLGRLEPIGPPLLLLPSHLSVRGS